jgi:carboxymethylenebutenolidase
MSVFQTSFLRRLRTLGLLLLSTLTVTGSPATRFEEVIVTHQYEEVTFSSGKLVLHGFIHKPEGKGPFPAVLMNHGSEQIPQSGGIIAKPFVDRGFVLFFPHRRGQGRSSDQSEYIMDLIRQEPEATRGQRYVELQEIHQEDVIAALSYLKRLPYVDQSKIAIAGASFGGIQTVLASEKTLGLQAAIAFAPAAMAWAQVPELRFRMLKAVRSATVPILFIQAKNDYDLSPTRKMAKELRKAQKMHKRLVFPAFGKTHADGHSFSFRGQKIWGNEVFSFLTSAMS